MSDAGKRPNEVNWNSDENALTLLSNVDCDEVLSIRILKGRADDGNERDDGRRSHDLN